MASLLDCVGLDENIFDNNYRLRMALKKRYEEEKAERERTIPNQETFSYPTANANIPRYLPTVFGDKGKGESEDNLRSEQSSPDFFENEVIEAAESPRFS